MTRRLCPHCHTRVRTIPEAAKPHEPLTDIVMVFAEHDPCPGSYEPVEAPPVQVHAEPIEEATRAPSRADREPAVLAILRRGPATARQVADEMLVSDRLVQATLAKLCKRGEVVRARAKTVRSAYVYGLPCPVRGPVAAEVWSHLLSGPVQADELAERMRRPLDGVKAVIGRLRTAGAVEWRDGRWVAGRRAA